MKFLYIYPQIWSSISNFFHSSSSDKCEIQFKFQFSKQKNKSITHLHNTHNTFSTYSLAWIHPPPPPRPRQSISISSCSRANNETWHVLFTCIRACIKMQMEEQQRSPPRPMSTVSRPCGRHPPGTSNYAAITWIINNRYPTAARTRRITLAISSELYMGEGSMRNAIHYVVDLSMQRLFEFSSSGRILSASSKSCGERERLGLYMYC